MKRLSVWLGILALVLFSAGAVFAQDSGDEHAEMLIRELLEQWQDGLNTEDIEAFLDCYWDDAVRIMYFPGNEPQITAGKPALRAEEEESFAQYDYTTMNLVYDEPMLFFPERANPGAILPNFDIGFMDVFEFDYRYGSMRIVRQYLFPLPTEP